MTPPDKRSWTLKKQLRLLFLLSGLMVVLLSALGGWRLQQFNSKNHELQQTSQTLRDDLAQNFDNGRLLTEIQTRLRKYMRSATPGVLHNIHTLAESLRTGLPEDLKVQLTDFIKKLDILEIRMNSFRQNNETIYTIEREIMQVTDTLLKEVSFEFHVAIRQLSTQACLKHHQLYKIVILTDEQDSLQMTSQQYEQMFSQLEEKIDNLKKKLPTGNSIKQLQTAFYKLDESVSTITAIRRVTLETQNDVELKLASLRQAVADDSLSQANVLASLTQSGLAILKNNLVAMSAIMILGAFLGGVTALVLNLTMVKPLTAFTTMLKKMTRMLSGLRKENEFEEDFSTMLESMTDQRNDEIGQVATSVKQLLLRLRELAVFRQDIEGDENTNEVYQRLARIFSERLQLTSFVIYELSPDGKIMHPALEHISIDGIDLPETTLTDECRARRNAGIISSFKDSHTCSRFPIADTVRHVCIPMQISGQVIGLVQFLFAPDTVDENDQLITDALVEARHYKAEALPVLHAKRLTLRLQNMAMEDSLTGLFNRHYLETSLDRLVAGIKRRGGNICVLMCDLDHFKSVNDSYGHDAGDQVLSQLAKILLNNVRETDFVIRYGGEEFLILLVDCDTPTSCEMAERIRQKVQAYKFHIPGNSIRMTISIGTARFPVTPDQEIWNTFKCADIALYWAKENGRNQVVDYSSTTHNKEPLNPSG